MRDYVIEVYLLVKEYIVMIRDAKILEASRMAGLSIDEYPLLHERHRVFPEIFEDRGHKKIVALVIFTPTSTPASPCGACRQVIYEFANQAHS